jgi:hypothetical protein
MADMSIPPCSELERLSAQLAVACSNLQASHTFQSQQLLDQLHLAMTKHRKTCLRCTWISRKKNHANEIVKTLDHIAGG